MDDGRKQRMRYRMRILRNTIRTATGQTGWRKTAGGRRWQMPITGSICPGRKKEGNRDELS